MIRDWLEEYKPANKEDAEAALREIMQEVSLAGLQRAGFFEKAAFYGGTALRIFHGLNRYSEDLDFSLLQPDAAFSLESYLEGVITEFSAIGMEVTVKEKVKTSRTNVDSAFLKSGTVWKELVLEDVIPQSGLQQAPQIKIKLEIDKAPPPGFDTEENLLLKPFSFYVKCFTLPDLYAGKMHALLFRKWKSRVKGRDWYDMEWYIRKNVPLHLEHFALRAYDSGDWKTKTITQQQFKKLLNEKIESVSMEAVKEDIRRFIPNDQVLDIWSRVYFHNLVEKIKFT